MDGHTCFHCKEWVPAGHAHDCWTTTEHALTSDLPDDLREAWERLRETAAAFGDQRIYASHHSIMFARSACYAFVRPRPSRLDVCVFLGRTVKGPQVKNATATSRVKVAHMIHVRHRDEVEAPLTDWLREAFDVCDDLSARGRRRAGPKATGAAASEQAARRPKKGAGPARRTSRPRPARKAGPARKTPRR